QFDNGLDDGSDEDPYPDSQGTYNSDDHYASTDSDL
ncbi:hypothetical protein A2U01_0025368, partial [Trifolium medium]|nr:hypothetical protein [Trifolium medium]